MRWLVGLFLMAHGLLHTVIWAAPSRADAPFDAHRSPFLGDIRLVSTVLGVLAGAVLSLSGVGHLTGAAWWPEAAVAGAAMSFVLMLLTFTPWWLLAMAIDVAVMVLAWPVDGAWGPE